jgi:hypothetical protein
MNYVLRMDEWARLCGNSAGQKSFFLLCGNSAGAENLRRTCGNSAKLPEFYGGLAEIPQVRRRFTAVSCDFRKAADTHKDLKDFKYLKDFKVLTDLTE